MSEPVIERPAPLRDAVYRRVVEMVTTGRLSPGQAVTEAALSRQLGVSRTPIREALLRLEAESVLESAPARGFSVRPLASTEAADLYPILGALERLAVQTTPTDAFDLPRLETLDASLRATDDPLEQWRLDTEFHEGLTSACPNANLRTMIASLRVRLSRYELAYMQVADRHRGAAPLHARILAALAAADTDTAANLTAENWQEGQRLVLAWLDTP